MVASSKSSKPSGARERFFYDVRQYALLQNSDGKILVLQLPAHCGDAAEKWTLPGGKLEPTDTPEGGLLREISEETGLKTSGLELVAMKRWATENSEKLGVFYTASVVDTKLLLSEEHKAARWVDARDAAALVFYRSEVAEVVGEFLQHS